MPTQEFRSRDDAFVCGSDYNIAAVQKDEYLQTCYVEPFSDVRYKLLSHNHMMNVLRAFMTRAKWELPPIEDKDKTIVLCDADGRLSITAVAESVHGKEILDVVNDGVECEVLSWKIDVEEPTAASIISQALNKGHDLALRTTEWTALSVLKGEIIVQSGPISQRVAFKSVLDAVHRQLDSAAEDPDLVDLFCLLIGVGVRKNSFF